MFGQYWRASVGIFCLSRREKCLACPAFGFQLDRKPGWRASVSSHF
jgi:hypothetical protein